MRLVETERWNICCDNCGKFGNTYVLGDQLGYGRHIGKTSNNEYAEFDGLNDQVFNEVKSFITLIMSSQEQFITDCIFLVLGITCDLSPSGKLFDFSGKLICPECNSDKVSFGPDNPRVFETITLPYVTHKAWKKLNEKEKKEIILEQLKTHKCLE